MKRCCKGQDRVVEKTDDLEIIFQWFRANMAKGVVKYVNICHCSSDKTVRGECLKQRLLLETLIKNVSKEFCVCSVRNLPFSLSVNWAAVQISHIVLWQNWSWSHISGVLTLPYFSPFTIMGRKEDKENEWPEIEYLPPLSHLTLNISNVLNPHIQMQVTLFFKFIKL